MADGTPDRTWDPVPDWPSFRLAGPGVTVRTVDPGPLALVDGRTSAALAGLGLTASGWPDPVGDGHFALSIAVDRVLLAGTTLAPGWHEEGYAVAACDGAIVVFEIDGPRTWTLLAGITDARPDRPSRSCAVLAAGVGAFLCSTGRGAVRLWVPHPRAAGVAARVQAEIQRL